jgi:chaperonin GroEL (HSP60 family)
MPKPATQTSVPRGSTSKKPIKGVSKSRVTPLLRSNMLSARLVAEIMKASFGPRGLDKMFLDNVGAIHATSQGVEILTMAKSEHPIARLIAEMGRALDHEVGDGTISAVILMSALVDRALELIEKGVHPSSVIRGYNMALDRALQELDEVAVPVAHDSKGWLVKAAQTCIGSKLAVKGGPAIPEMVATAALQATEKRGEGYILDTSRIKVQMMPGGALSDSRLLHGIVIEKDLILRNMPRRIENAKILVGDVSLVLKKTIMDAKITMSDPRLVAKLGQDRRFQLKRIADRILASGANVVINREGCDDLVADQLANQGIMVLRHVKILDVTNVAEATGATVVDAKHDIRPGDLGYAALVEEKKVEGAPKADKWLFIEGCKNPKSMTILLRAGTAFVVDEAHRSIQNSIKVMKGLVEHPSVVAGGGAVEAELASRIRRWSVELRGREQLAAEGFAASLEEIPSALAEKAGMRHLDAMTELTARHADGGMWIGVDSKTGKLTDTYLEGIVEPSVVKAQVLKSATETACTILRTDFVLNKDSRAFRRKSEMTPEQRKRLQKPTRRESEDFLADAKKFPINIPKDRRYPL